MYMLLCYQHHSVDSNPSFSSSHTLILLSDCTFGTAVVLEVILVTWATLKVTELLNYANCQTYFTLTV